MRHPDHEQGAPRLPYADTGKRKRRGRGEGSIEVLPSGHYRRVISAGTDPVTGQRRKLSATFRDKQAALEWRDEQKRLLRQGLSADAGRLTVGDWLRRWLALVKPTVAPGTYRPYEDHVERYLVPRLGAVPLGQLSALRIEGAYAELALGGTSAKMIRKAAVTLGVALQKAVKQRLIPINPARDATRPRAERPETKVMTADELRAFLAAAEQDRLYALWVVWADSGARQGEVYGLRWCDVDWDGGALNLTRALSEVGGTLTLRELKTKRSRRRVPLSPVTMEVLAEHRKRMLAAGHYRADGPVFCNVRGGWLRKSNVQRGPWKNTLKRAALPHFKPYSLRHCTATLLLLQGVDPRVVADRLGHSTTRLTQDTYQHVVEGMQRQATDKLQSVLWPHRTAKGGRGEQSAG